MLILKKIERVDSGEWMKGKGVPFRCDEKSAEPIDFKGVASAPLAQRVWNRMKGKEMNAVPSKARGREAWVGWIGPEGEKRTERRGRISGLALEDRAEATPYYSTLLLIVK